jgi:hypothetical protein
MWSWMLFVLGGIGVEKAAEHWQAAVPAADAGLPDVAFGVLFVAAAIASVLVLSGVAFAGGAVVAFLRRGGWEQIRRPIYRAGTTTALTAVGLLSIGLWARHLSDAQRNGHDGLYGAAVLLWALLFAVCLFSWAAAAVSTARRLNLTPRVLIVESRLAVVVTGAMAAVTIASAVWWAAVADTAPWFFSGTAPGSPGMVAPINLVIPLAFMLTATLVACAGARRALQNARLIANDPGRP